MAGGDITAAMHSLLDDDQYLNLIQHEHEIVKAHKDFRLFATMNPSHASNYAGTKPNNSAFLSRFGAVISFEYLKPELEEQLILDKCTGAKQPIAAVFVSIATDKQPSFVTLVQALKDYRATMTTKADQLANDKFQTLKKDYELQLTKKTAELTKREASIKADEMAIEKRGYEQCKREFMAKLGDF
jgi:MoxR-like ATPase